jgi:hypothetical protein
VLGCFGFHFHVVSVGEGVDCGPGTRGRATDKRIVQEEGTPLTRSRPLARPFGPLPTQIPFASSRAAQVPGGPAIFVRPAEEFGPAVELFEKVRVPEGGDEFALVARAWSELVYFHGQLWICYV